MARRTRSPWSSPRLSKRHCANSRHRQTARVGTQARPSRFGTYGTRVAAERQLYQCQPKDPDVKLHTFAAVLPRDHVDRGNEDCAQCRELRGIHRGEEAAARRHTWSARVVAHGLDRLSSGETYASVSKWALRVAGGGKRTRKNAKGKYRTGPQRSKHVWHIAADWVEVFGPVVWDEAVERLEVRAQRARKAGLPVVWLIDDTSVLKRTGRSDTSAQEGFNLLVVSEWVGDGADAAGQLRLVRALPTRTTEAWKLVLEEPGYAPDIVVSDAASAQKIAARSLFPGVRVVPCIWHVTNANTRGPRRSARCLHHDSRRLRAAAPRSRTAPAPAGAGQWRPR